MKDRMNIQEAVIQSKMRESESGMKNSLQESGTDEATKPYTFPLDPERKERIAKAFQRRIEIQTPVDSIKKSGW